MTAQDVAGVIAECLRADGVVSVDIETTLKLVGAVKHQAQALSEARDDLDRADKGTSIWQARALAAESRLAEAMRVIERLGSSQTFTVPFAMDQSSIACELKARIDAARDFLNAAKEKT